MDKTVQGRRYRTNHFVRWCNENSIEHLNDISGRDLHEYRLWRKEDGKLNKVSVQTQMSTLRVYLKWCASLDAVDPDLYSKVLVASVSTEESRRHEMLDGERAQHILEHLSMYQYASREHVLLASSRVRESSWGPDDGADRCMRRAGNRSFGSRSPGSSSGYEDSPSCRMPPVCGMWGNQDQNGSATLASTRLDRSIRYAGSRRLPRSFRTGRDRTRASSDSYTSGSSGPFGPRGGR